MLNGKSCGLKKRKVKCKYERNWNIIGIIRKGNNYLEMVICIFFVLSMYWFFCLFLMYMYLMYSFCYYCWNSFCLFIL